LKRIAALLMFAALTAQAADAPAKLEPLPEIPPPPGLPAEDLEPQITIVQRGADKVEEFRLQGRLYMLKITPSHGVPYYLIDEIGEGRYTRYDNLGADFRVPMWVLFEF
jgi:hypothetical protein